MTVAVVVRTAAEIANELAVATPYATVLATISLQHLKNPRRPKATQSSYTLRCDTSSGVLGTKVLLAMHLGNLARMTPKLVCDLAARVFWWA